MSHRGVWWGGGAEGGYCFQGGSGLGWVVDAEYPGALPGGDGPVRGAISPVCAQTRPRPCAAATPARSGSAPPQVSLSRSAAATATASPTSARQVSTLITMLG